MFNLDDRVRVDNYAGGNDMVGMEGQVIRITPNFIEVQFDGHYPMLFKESELDKIEQ